MNTQPVTVQMPENLYERLQLLAEKRKSSLESELIEVVANALPVEEEQLSAELNQLLNDLSVLDDKALWQAGRSHLPRSASERLEFLHHKRQREGLTPTERDESTTLLAQYERYLLVRAQAAALLQQRGFGVAELIQ